VSVNPAAVISGEVIVGEGSLVGAAATVLQGLSVGQGSVLGAACLVTKDVPGGVVVKGVPGQWTEYD
jgi:acetyltransferase-like isoleucine patch superfamily enzyme